jgi:hypothetical protein
MKSVEFCYWLQGLFELGNPATLDVTQTELVKRHLAMVFKHEIDPSYGKAEAQAALSALHQGSKPVPVAHDHVHTGDVLLRC